MAKDSGGTFVVAVEAKADEPFGRTMDETSRAAIGRLSKNPGSKGLVRIHQLVEAICGPEVGADAVKTYRYQLFTATGAALAEAERRSAERAVLMIHEFVTRRTNDALRRKNAADLNAFVQLVSRGAVKSIQPGQLVGPFHVGGVPLVELAAELYVGKAIRELSKRAS